jgi:PadR family transcriptional regulator PadR
MSAGRSANRNCDQRIIGREAKVYSLTRAGRKQLDVEKDSWMRLAGAVRLIFNEGNRS